MRVAKWGNSLALRLPSAVVDALDLKPGDDVRVEVMGTGALEISRSPDRLELLERLRKHRGLLPRDFRFDRIEANTRE